ncbi:MAG: protein kinase [Candidatus Zixiibacteriota bacterium]
MIGQTISHYNITAKIGEGGMGEVYLATDTNLDRPVALKFLPESLRNEPEPRERLLREAKAASKLNHKNILTIHAVESSDGHDFIVMEYIEGRSLKEILDSREDLPIPELLRIGLQICDGLATAHEQGVVHRDIKPANILVTPKGQVKITDFGLATWKGATQLTKEGSTVGTAAYMSPEQVQGKPVDARCDIFSTGVVLYELITRRQPFQGGHDAAIAYSILNDLPEPMARYKSGLHSGLQEIIDRALDKDPSTRYQSATGMLADLKRVRRDTEGSNPSAISRTMPVQARRSLSKPILAGSGILAITLVLLVLFVLKPFRVEVTPDQQATASENSLAVMYFDNLVDSGDKDKTAQMITSLLITGLSESQYLQVVSRQRLYDLLTQLGKGEAVSIDRTTASDVARRANVRWMVTGEIMQIAPRIVLTAEVSEVQSGKLVTTQKIAGQPGEDIFTTAERLGSAIRGNLTLPAPVQAQGTSPASLATTHSPEAYRHYLEGLDLGWKFYAREARESLMKALSYDSTFAMAYYQLALLPDPQNAIDQKDREAWIASAVRFAGNASWKEQRYIQAASHTFRNQLAEAVGVYSEVLERYPNDIEALWGAGLFSRELGRNEKAVEYFERIVAADPQFADAYNQLAYTYQRLGNSDRSIRAINQYIALNLNDANPYDSRGDLYGYEGMIPEAIESFRKSLQMNPAFGTDEKLGYMFIHARDYARAESTFQAMAKSTDRVTRSKGRACMPLTLAHQGRFIEALRVVEDAISADRLEGYEGFWLFAKLAQSVSYLLAAGDQRGAIAASEDAGAVYRKLFPTDVVGARDLEASARAAGGDTASALSIYERIRHAIRTSPDSNSYFVSLAAARAHTARLTGDIPTAAAEFEYIPLDRRDSHLTYALGKVYLDLGRLENAVQTLERGIKRLDEETAFLSFFAVRCHYLLGRAYEESGWTDKAATKYREFLEIWKNADPGIPEVEDAKARLARLTS